MDNNSSKSPLIGITSVDTLVNISAVIMLLKSLELHDTINEKAEDGLHLIYTLIQKALEYEINSLDTINRRK